MVDHPFFSGHAAEVGEGPGRGHTLNLPLPHGTAAPAWLAALEQAIDATLERGVEAVVVSLGVDTFERDPISRFALTLDPAVDRSPALARPHEHERLRSRRPSPAG